MEGGVRNLRALLRLLEQERDKILQTPSPGDGDDASESPPVDMGSLAGIQREIETVGSAMNLLEKYGASFVHPRRDKAARDSNIDLTIRVLDVAKRPMRVDDIILLIKQKYGRSVKKGSLTSRMAKLAKQGRVFAHRGPNTFELRPSVQARPAVVITPADIDEIQGIKRAVIDDDDSDVPYKPRSPDDLPDPDADDFDDEPPRPSELDED